MRYSLTFLLLIFTIVVFSQKKYDLVRDFGAVGNDQFDCYDAFQKAAKAISENGGGVLNIPKGKYYIGQYKINGGPDKNKVIDIIFRNCNGLIINGNGSTVRVNGKFTKTADYKLKGLDFVYSYKNTVCPFCFTNCKNVVLNDIVLYGEVDKMKRIGPIKEGWNYGVLIFDSEKSDTCKNITIKNVVAHHFSTDGMMIKSVGEIFNIIDCNFYCNARQGLSITKGHNTTCINSNFDSTGITGSYGRHSPSAGIDVETGNGRNSLTNVYIVKCNFRGNMGFQLTATVPAINVKVDSCFFSDYTSGYGEGLNGVGIHSYSSTLSNSIIFGTIQADIANRVAKGDTMVNIVNNIIYSGNRGIVAATFHRPMNISDNIFIMLPQPKNSYFPYIQNKNSLFNNNIIVLHPDRIQVKTISTSLVQSSKEVKNNFWLLNKDGFTDEKKENLFYRIQFDKSRSISNQFFPSNNFTKKINYPGKKILPENNINDILSSKLFTSFKQKEFDEKYLKQANEVRVKAKAIINSNY